MITHNIKNWLVQAIILGSILLSAPALAVCGSTFQDSGHDFELTLLDVLPSPPSNGRTVVGQMETLHIITSVWNCGPDKKPVEVRIEYLLKREGQSDGETSTLFSVISDPISKNTGQILFAEIHIPMTIPPGDYVLSAVVQPVDRRMASDLNPDNNVKETGLSIIQGGYNGKPPKENHPIQSVPPGTVEMALNLPVEGMS